MTVGLFYGGVSPEHEVSVISTLQAAHALRHTFASHFIQNGGNILNLQKVLGHSNLVMTMRYAHLEPDHLQDAVRFGPLS